MEKYRAAHPVPVGKIFFRLYDYPDMTVYLESRVQVPDIQKLREQSGSAELYCDYDIPSHFYRYKTKRLQKNQHIEIVEKKKVDHEKVKSKIKKS